MRRLLSFVWAMVRPIRKPRTSPWAATLAGMQYRRLLAGKMAETRPGSPLHYEMLLQECGDDYLLAQMVDDLSQRAHVSHDTALRLLDYAQQKRREERRQSPVTFETQYLQECGECREPLTTKAAMLNHRCSR